MPSTDSSPSADRKRCAVVVVNWNGGELTARCLRSLSGQSVPGVDIEIVVVDNASTDGSDRNLEQAFPRVHLVRLAENSGFAGGANAGIRATSADYVVLINNDAVAEPGFLRALLAPLIAGPDSLAAVTARIVLSGRFTRAEPGDPGAYRNAAGEHWKRTDDGSGIELLNSTGNLVSASGNGRDRSWLTPIRVDDSPSEVFGFCGGGAALRRTAFDASGGFDDDLFLYYEDTDLSWRMRRLGFTIAYEKDAVLHHDHAASSGVWSRRFLVQNFRNRILVTARNAPTAMTVVALARTLASALKALTGVLTPARRSTSRLQASAAFAALWSALRLLPRYRKAGRELDHRATIERGFIRDWSVPD